MKKYLVTIIGLVLLVVVLAGVKGMQFGAMMNAAETMVMPPTVVSAIAAEEQDWEQTLTAVGTLEAVQGVMVTADIPGRITEILFTGGAEVKKGDILLRQDVSSEEAQLRAAEASAALAKSNLIRVTELLRKSVASKSEFDAADARYKEAVAQADSIRTTIEKKSVRAPFDGRLGIRLVNVGADLGTGDPIASLQAVNPIYVNFSLPQQDLPKLKLGLEVRITSDAVASRVFTGTITAINPEIDPSTRSLRVQASLENADHSLLPGMFANVDVVLPEVEHVLAVPVTAVAYATYGDSVFVVTEETNEETKAVTQVARQHFVRLGKSRGDFVAVEAGIDAGAEVVSAGVFKLRNGAPITINNDTQPTFSLDPHPADS